MEFQPTEIIDLLFNHVSPYVLKTEQQAKHFEMSLYALYCQVRWFIKLEYPKQSIVDIPLIYREHHKLNGILLQEIFNLCVKTHGKQFTNIKIPEYRNASEWFLLILKDNLNSRLNQCINPFTLPENIFNGENKKYLLGIYSKQLTRINNYDNPYREDPDMKHFSYLLDCVFKQCEQDPNFKKKYLRPFIKAGRDVIQDYFSPRWERLYVDEGNLCINRSGSKSKKILR